MEKKRKPSIFPFLISVIGLVALAMAFQNCSPLSRIGQEELQSRPEQLISSKNSGSD